MSEMKKSADGLLMYEDFSDPNTLMWALSPSYMTNSLEYGVKGPVVTEKGLRIKHSPKYITFTIPEPIDREEYGCIFDLHHVPINFDDIGGVIVISSNNHYVECQTYLATGESGITNKNSEPEVVDATYQNPYSVAGYIDTIYRYIKVYKVKYKYFFYASADGINWITVGSASFEVSCVIGLFLYGTEDMYLAQNGRFKCNSIAFYTSRFFNIYGIDVTKEIIMYSNDEIILRTNNADSFHLFSRVSKSMVINTTTLPMPLENVKIQVSDRDGVIYNEYELGTVYGGDEFILETNLKIFIDEDEVLPDEMYELGKFYHGSNYIQMRIHNYDTEPADNVKLHIDRYSSYYGGDKEVLLALYEEGTSMGELQFDKQIMIDRIWPGSGVTVYMKLDDRPVQDYFMSANEYRFKIIIE